MVCTGRPSPGTTSPPSPPLTRPRPPPQRNTSYLKTQVVSPDALYTATFVSYAGDEEDDEEGEEASRASALSGQPKLSATRKSYGDLPVSGHGKPRPPPTARKPRPLSDGIFLSSSFQLPVNNSNSTGHAPPPPTKPSFLKGRARGGARHGASPP